MDNILPLIEACAKRKRDALAKNLEQQGGFTAYWDDLDEVSKRLEVAEIADLIQPIIDEWNYQKGKWRMVVSHCTGGATQDTTLSTNHICVLATQKVNMAWEGGVEKGRKEGYDQGLKDGRDQGYEMGSVHG